ncbi:hypothetical protein SDC9_193883 [bioreactor metagenome]|uniref:Uncharacterized protein n=1 Tax=bioreactor metagenome TaxID=1076179 RepID=A0A645I4S3_9ZZZZ
MRGRFGGGRLLARLLFPVALVLALVDEAVAAGQLAALHARVTRQIVDLRAAVIDFVRATPAAGHLSAPCPTNP